MPNRYLKESICTSGTVSQLSPLAQVLYFRLIVTCDDFGLFIASEQVILGRCFPFDAHHFSKKGIGSVLAELQKVGAVHLYEDQKRPFGQVINFTIHNQVRSSRPKYPLPSKMSPDLLSAIKKYCPNFLQTDRLQTSSNCDQDSSEPMLDTIPGSLTGSCSLTGSYSSEGESEGEGFSTVALTLARSLRTAILTAKPDHKTIADSDVERWSRDIGLMLRLDGRSRERIEAVLAWLPSDDFWPPNIQSGKKLREKFDKLEDKMRRPAAGKSKEGEVFMPPSTMTEEDIKAISW